MASLPRLVEDGARHWGTAARGDYALALVDASVQQVADESPAIGDAHQRQRLTAPGCLRTQLFGLILPFGKAFPRADNWRERHDSVFLKRRVNLRAHRFSIEGRVDIDSSL
jgi:hypothetical protein